MTAQPFPQSQCTSCRHLRIVQTAASVFLRCVEMPRKYPPQPVSSCSGFAAAIEVVPPASEAGDGVARADGDL